MSLDEAYKFRMRGATRTRMCRSATASS